MSTRRVRVVIVFALCAVFTMGLAGPADAKKKKKVVKTTLSIEQVDSEFVSARVSVNKKLVSGRLARSLCEQPGSAAEEREPVLHVDGQALNPNVFRPPLDDRTLGYGWDRDGGFFAGKALVAEIEKRTIPKGIFGNKKIVCKAATSNQLTGF